MPDIKAQASQWVAKQASVAKGDFREQMERNYVWNRWCVSTTPVNQLIYDALLLLQHRGQDAAGIVTQQERKFFMHKAKGMVKDVFRTRNMRALPGDVGLGQVRYPRPAMPPARKRLSPST
jgi:hypothetical protein